MDYRVVGGAVVVLPHLSGTPIMFPLITLCSHYSILIRFNISFLSLDRVCNLHGRKQIIIHNNKNDRPGDDGTLRIVKLLVFLLGVIDLASVSRIERELGGLEECVYWLWSVHGSIREWLEVRYIADRIWNCGQTPCWLGLAGADAARQHERVQGLLWWGRSISLSIKIRNVQQYIVMCHVSSYHHIIISSYHHIIISSYHHIIISSYHHIIIS